MALRLRSGHAWPWVARKRLEDEHWLRVTAEAERDRAMESLAMLKTQIGVRERHYELMLRGRPARCPNCKQYRARTGVHECPKSRKELTDGN